MPLTQRVTFKTILKKNNIMQVPKLVREQFKLDATQVIKVTVSVATLLRARESFLARMQKYGRIAVPQLTINLLKHDRASLEGYVIEVTLEPAQQGNH